MSVTIIMKCDPGISIRNLKNLMAMLVLMWWFRIPCMSEPANITSTSQSIVTVMNEKGNALLSILSQHESTCKRPEGRLR